jgi:phage shock protein A
VAIGILSQWRSRKAWYTARHDELADLHDEVARLRDEVDRLRERVEGRNSGSNAIKARD